jgi:2-C-methyl-D-erythritol 2,4-cyclodiphosphate synthase
VRVGIGYDTHRLTEGRKLILGGVDIPADKGLLGHSDADVLVHAVIDAILGAMGEKSIGELFPDTDARYKGISSLLLLEEIAILLDEKETEIVNIDSTIVIQEPKLASYIGKMKENMSKVLKVDVSKIGIKAKTEEGLGFTGSGQGVKAYAVCLVKEA